MKALQRRNYSFDTRSVMLFAALSLGGVGALQAQTTSSPQFGPSDKTAPHAGSKNSTGPAVIAAPQATAASAAFDRADANKDGQLSAQEAAKLPAIGQRFKELDADKNGTLSRSEFEKGASS
ncbi:calcium-binding protein [Acidovorax sp. Leaf76]|uniref:calcium-binding protein n=1 Tax=unclassified Acidovorax TaxID=2684926 RepID=UPI0006FB1A1C|nr:MULTISPECIES: calcium-binding protein [unclassified Acidovorax]KQO26539.1 calcium-binding protein [Acidovorax sp. Leaf76]KQO40314.1 calcium-binding protein [Acidovorax sp. Leaf84]KQS42452.1 calcium-binding protein [Acidovorax sp. Leaf191]